MMRKCLGFLFFAVFLLTAGGASAQFTITPPGVGDAGRHDFPDTLRRARLANDYTSLARLRAERQALRRQRNYVEFTAKMDMSLNQFDNWAPGGTNTFTGRSSIFFRHQYKVKKFELDYRFDMRYGMNYIDERMFKNEDKLRIDVLTTWDFYRHWSYSVTAALNTQFTESEKSRTDDTKVSNFMSPGTFDLAVGVTYKSSPWTVVISPVGGRAVFVTDRGVRAYGVNDGRASRWQMGSSLDVKFDKGFSQNRVHVRSELYAFTNFNAPPSAWWEMAIELKATKFLTTTLYGKAVYDRTAGSKVEDFNAHRIQYNYLIGVGLAYTFKNKDKAQ